MEFNGALFLSYLFVWIITGVIVFNDIIPMIVFIASGGVGGVLIGATKKKK